MAYNKLDNPFYANYIFSKQDMNRCSISWWQYPSLWFKPTCIQVDTVKNDSGEYENWVFHYKLSGGKIFLMRIETLEEGKKIEQP